MKQSGLEAVQGSGPERRAWNQGNCLWDEGDVPWNQVVGLENEFIPGSNIMVSCITKAYQKSV